MGLHFISVNNDALNELPADLREKFLAACNKLNRDLQKATFEKDAYAIKQAMRENGARFKWMEPNLREEARQKMAPSWEKWVKRTGGDAEKILTKINKFHDEYLKK
jgi:TRAP-type C4-dicarboxylate transport system substrate-binding protein